MKRPPVLCVSEKVVSGLENRPEIENNIEMRHFARTVYALLLTDRKLIALIGYVHVSELQLIQPNRNFKPKSLSLHIKCTEASIITIRGT